MNHVLLEDGKSVFKVSKMFNENVMLDILSMEVM